MVEEETFFIKVQFAGAAKVLTAGAASFEIVCVVRIRHFVRIRIFCQLLLSLCLWETRILTSSGIPSWLLFMAIVELHV